MARSSTLFITMAALAAMVSAAPAFAHSSSSSGGSSAGGSSAGGSTEKTTDLKKQPPSCQHGYVVKDGGCVHASIGVLPDHELYAQGEALALAGRYTDALLVLDLIRRTDDAMVYTMRGYAQRKLGRLDTGMALYPRALAIDPNNIDTHEYLGELYVQQARPDLARVELATVRRLCGGTACEQYEDLAGAIQTGAAE